MVGKRRYIVLRAAAFLLLAMSGCQQLDGPTPLPKPSLLPARHAETAAASRQREELERFVRTRMTGPFGVYTNLLETKQDKETATGHEVLSESAGLLMRYAALTGDRPRFDDEWALARRTFDLTDVFSYRYSPLSGKIYTLNAAIDDLRIIRALHEASARFGEARYAEEAAGYGARFLRTNVKDGRMYDFYDEAYGKTNGFITLCYIDLKTLLLLPGAAGEQEPLLRNMDAIARGGYLSDAFPFYETRYDYGSGKYQSETIQTVESLLTVLSLAEVDRHNPASVRYIKEQVKAGTLYGQYTREGKPASSIQSTAIYGIAAMIGAETRDEELYRTGIERMNGLRVDDPTSPLAGAFGDPATGQAYSFDNLMALLAYAY